MKRKFLNKSLLGILMVLLFAAVFSQSVNAKALQLVKMNPGQSWTIKLPERWKGAKWSSNSKKVAKVNSRGVVRAAAPGKAVITVKKGKNQKKYTIKVYKVQLSRSKVVMETGEAKKLTVKNSFGKVRWSSNGEAVRVNSKGKITAVKAGKAVITATVFKKKYKCRVIVKDREKKDDEMKDDEMKDDEIKDGEMEDGEMKDGEMKDDEKKDGDKMKIQVGDTIFTATLAENSSVDALKELMADGPLTLNMSDYAGMEKGADLGVRLPQNNEPMNTQAGDIILYQGRTFVIYYDTNSWSLTPIGKIDNVDAKELRKVLGTGDVTVTLSIE